MLFEEVVFDGDPFGSQCDSWCCCHGECGVVVLKHCGFDSGSGTLSQVHVMLHFSQEGPHGKQLLHGLAQWDEL